MKSINDEDLPIPKEDYLKLVMLCMKFGCFSYNDEEYVQISGLAMGSPLSTMTACLFMEGLEDLFFENYWPIIDLASIRGRYLRCSAKRN